MKVLPKTNLLFYGAVAFAFLYVSIFALPTMAITHHHDGVSMSNCPLMFGENAVCDMSIFDHIASWKAMFAVLPIKLTATVLLLTSFVIAFIRLRYLFDPPDASQEKFLFSFLAEGQLGSLFAVLILGSVVSPRAP